MAKVWVKKFISEKKKRTKVNLIQNLNHIPFLNNDINVGGEILSLLILPDKHPIDFSKK